MMGSMTKPNSKEKNLTETIFFIISVLSGYQIDDMIFLVFVKRVQDFKTHSTP